MINGNERIIRLLILPRRNYVCRHGNRTSRPLPMVNCKIWGRGGVCIANPGLHAAETTGRFKYGLCFDAFSHCDPPPPSRPPSTKQITGIHRGAFKNRGALYTPWGCSIRCVKEDQSAVSNTVHYLSDGTCTFKFYIKKQVCQKKRIFFEGVGIFCYLCHSEVANDQCCTSRRGQVTSKGSPFLATRMF